MAQISSFGGLQTSLRGLLAHQRMLDVASHNIGNADTVGYTRQTTVASAAAGIAVNGATNGGVNWLGQGVDVTAFNRMRDEYLDISARTQNMLLGERGALAEGLSRADAAFSEPSDQGLNALMDKMWTSFQKLSTNPSDSGVRAQVVADAKNLTDAMKEIDSRLAQIGADAATQYAQLTSAPGNKVGAYADELSKLNDAIGEAVAAGQQPNDMLDRRDLILDELAQLGQVSVSNQGNGRISVSFGDASSPLVDGSGQPSVATWPQALVNPGGQLGGLIKVQTAISDYRAQLDNVASSLASSVNAVHGAPPFFTGATAGTLAVNVTAATLVAGTGTGAASNDVALALSQLRGGTSDRAYQDLVRQTGSDAQNAATMRDLSVSLVNDVESRRQSVSGVSLDEEMTDLIRFQRGYQASSRAMSTMDEMLDVLINRTGRVGL